MVKRITREEGGFKVAEYDYKNYYFQAWYKERIYAEVHIQVCQGLAYVHLEVTQFGKEILTQMRKDFKELKDFCRMVGCNVISGTHVLGGWGKWWKLMRLLGFKEVLEVKLESGVCKFVKMEV